LREKNSKFLNTGFIQSAVGDPSDEKIHNTANDVSEADLIVHPRGYFMAASGLKIYLYRLSLPMVVNCMV